MFFFVIYSFFNFKFEDSFQFFIRLYLYLKFFYTFNTNSKSIFISEIFKNISIGLAQEILSILDVLKVSKNKFFTRKIYFKIHNFLFSFNHGYFRVLKIKRKPDFDIFKTLSDSFKFHNSIKLNVFFLCKEKKLSSLKNINRKHNFIISNFFYIFLVISVKFSIKNLKYTCLKNDFCKQFSKKNPNTHILPSIREVKVKKINKISYTKINQKIELESLNLIFPFTSNIGCWEKSGKIQHDKFTFRSLKEFTISRFIKLNFILVNIISYFSFPGSLKKD